jgi:putative peptide zinc metalloprotease protein
MRFARTPKLLLVLLIAVIGLAFAGARAESARADTGAVAVNTKDGSSLFRFAFGIRRVMNGVVDESNSAVAYASCDSCRTVAISIQIVLVMGPATTVTPTNTAIAVNEGCNLCETLADAYQFVVSTGGPVRFTAQGESELAEIRRELAGLQDNNDLSLDEIEQRVSDLVDRLRTVLQTQLVPVTSGETPEGESSDEGGGQATLTHKPASGAAETTQATESPPPTAQPPPAGGETTPTATETAPSATTTQTDTTGTTGTETAPPPGTDTTPPSTDTTDTTTTP